MSEGVGKVWGVVMVVKGVLVMLRRVMVRVMMGRMVMLVMVLCVG